MSFSDDAMREALAKVRTYAIVILRRGPQYERDDARAIVWEHGRRNFELRASGLLSVVCPIRDGSDVCGVGIFNAPPEEVDRLMRDDPSVAQGVLVYEVHPCSGFPGDALP